MSYRSGRLTRSCLFYLSFMLVAALTGGYFGILLAAGMTDESVVAVALVLAIVTVAAIYGLYFLIKRTAKGAINARPRSAPPPSEKPVYTPYTRVAPTATAIQPPNAINQQGVCPNCQKPLSADAKFCGSCGYQK